MLDTHTRARTHTEIWYTVIQVRYRLYLFIKTVYYIMYLIRKKVWMYPTNVSQMNTWCIVMFWVRIYSYRPTFILLLHSCISFKHKNVVALFGRMEQPIVYVCQLPAASSVWYVSCYLLNSQLFLYDCCLSSIWVKIMHIKLCLF